MTMKSTLDHLKNPRQDVDYELVFNLIQLINLTVENSDLLINQAIEKTVNAIIRQIIHEIFES